MCKTIRLGAVLAVAVCACLAMPLRALPAEEILTPEGAIGTPSDMGQSGHLKRGADTMMKGAALMLKNDEAGMTEGYTMLRDGHAVVKKAKMLDWGGKKVKKAADRMRLGADMMMTKDPNSMKNGRKILLDGQAMMQAGLKKMYQ